MAGGANKKFMDEKQRFLENNVVEVDVADGTLMAVASGHVDPTKAALASVGRVANTGQAVGVAATQKTAGIFEFDLFKTTTTAEATANGRAIKVPCYALRAWGTKKQDSKLVNNAVQWKTPTFAHPIAAYWVPWSANSGWSVQLGNAADYFFTATMDGCSLAISSGAAPIVTHGNYRSTSDPTRASQARTVGEMMTHHTNTLGTNVAKVLRKDDYAASHAEKQAGINKLVTVVGFRDTVHNTWSFYWQRRKMILGDAASGTHTKMVLQDRLVEIV
jgi:hypothetical protein